MTFTLEQIAINAYDDAYCRFVEWRTFEGKPTPAWGQLRDNIKAAWMAAAFCIRQVYAEVTDERARGERAYTAYGDSVQWVNYKGDPLSTWDDMAPKTQGAWISFAAYVVERADKIVL